jgi:hypothetical protein
VPTVKPTWDHAAGRLPDQRFSAIRGYARADTIIGMRVLGVDAYTKGWIGVELDHGTFVGAYIKGRLTALLSAVNDIQAVASTCRWGWSRPAGARQISTRTPSWAHAATAST